MQDQPPINLFGDAARNGLDLSLDHEVEVHSERAIQQRISDRPSNQAHARVEGRQRGRESRVREHPIEEPRILHVSYDPLSEKLPAQAPIAEPELAEALKRYEDLTVPELEDAFARNDADFKAWVQAPGNGERPIREFPGYVDRIAIDSLIERRTWWE